MKPSEQAYKMIRDWEKYQARAYKAVKTEKYYTIGYGHCGPDVQRYQFVTPERAEEILRQDVAAYSDKLSKQCPDLTQREYDALISLIYNIGWYRFSYSMTCKCMTGIRTKYSPEGCAARIVLWVRSADKILLGLQRRRVAEANYFLGYERYRLENGFIRVLVERN